MGVLLLTRTLQNLSYPLQNAEKNPLNQIRDAVPSILDVNFSSLKIDPPLSVSFFSGQKIPKRWKMKNLQIDPHA